MDWYSQNPHFNIVNRRISCDSSHVHTQYFAGKLTGSLQVHSVFPDPLIISTVSFCKRGRLLIHYMTSRQQSIFYLLHITSLLQKVSGHQMCCDTHLKTTTLLFAPYFLYPLKMMPTPNSALRRHTTTPFHRI